MRVSSVGEATSAPLQLQESTGIRVPTLPSEGVTGANEAAGTTSFGDVFKQVIDVANNADAAASQKVDDLAKGVGDDLHGTMIAVKEADISIKLVSTIRNKLLDAFTEIWKTSV